MAVTPVDPFGSVPDLQTALQTFSQGAKQFQLQNALVQANDEVQKIKSSQLKEQEKRAMLSGLANNLVLTMTGLGASAQDTANVFQSMRPALPASADQAVLQGLLEGNSDLVSQGRMAQTINMGDQLALEDAKTKRAMQLELMKEDAATKLQDRRLAAQKKTELKQADTDFLSNTQAALRNLQHLNKLVKDVGNFEGTSSIMSPVSNTGKGAVLQQLAYDTAIAYAKIVDPTSVAREGEVASAQKYSIPMGLGTSNKATLTALKNMEKMIKARASDRQKLRSEGAIDDFTRAFYLPQQGDADPNTQSDQTGMNKYFKKR